MLYLAVWPNVSNGDYPVLCVIGGEPSGLSFFPQLVIPPALCSAEIYFHKGSWMTIGNFIEKPRSYARAEFVDGEKVFFV